MWDNNSLQRGTPFFTVQGNHNVPIAGLFSLIGFCCMNYDGRICTSYWQIKILRTWQSHFLKVNHDREGTGYIINSARVSKVAQFSSLSSGRGPALCNCRTQDTMLTARAMPPRGRDKKSLLDFHMSKATFQFFCKKLTDLIIATSCPSARRNWCAQGNCYRFWRPAGNRECWFLPHRAGLPKVIRAGETDLYVENSVTSSLWRLF